jgi:hypothetical protein
MAVETICIHPLMHKKVVSGTVIMYVIKKKIPIPAETKNKTF